jgi:hypothetical protein
MPWFLALSLVVGLPPRASNPSGFLDAGRLVALCSASGPDALSGRSLCLGYVVGSVDQLLAQQARRGRATFCPPPGFKADDALATVMGHARYASAADGMAAAGFVRFALEDAYPCPVPVGPR